MMYKLNLKITVGVIVGAIVGLLLWFYGWHLITFFSLETLQCYAGYLLGFVHAHYYMTVFFYLAFGVGAVALFLPVVTLYMITAGFLFGPWFGALYAIIGVTLGALCAFMMVRATIGPWVQKYEQKLVTINHFITAYGFYALTFLRSLHLVPFFLLNIAAALMPVSPLVFTSSTFLGVIPGAFLFAWTGQYLCTIHSVWDLVNKQTLMIGGSVIVVLLMVLLLASYVMRRHNYTH
jgi:uncharacterized membrane protein YdjX (TVP38/TMEM64 family)